MVWGEAARLRVGDLVKALPLQLLSCFYQLNPYFLIPLTSLLPMLVEILCKWSIALVFVCDFVADDVFPVSDHCTPSSCVLSYDLGLNWLPHNSALVQDSTRINEVPF
jgi:hypothetical protein